MGNNNNNTVSPSMIIEQLERVTTLELENGQLLNKLEELIRQNNDFDERLNVALISLKAISCMQSSRPRKADKAKEIAQATLAVIL